ncbi:MAG: hypothetical protein K2N37_01195, partial [Lachnospiraceae bacterium]|nr:hypothetical protein [Lachnospiraceae bacterium]
YDNCIAVGVITLLSALLMGLFFDFYFDLNDDTMMRDILAGVYSGVPDGHNMQMLYPLGAFLALCYRLCRTIPWYGLFLCLCQFGSFYLVGLRLCALFRTKRGKLLSLLSLVLFQWGIWMTHMVNVQYTITCAMLSAAAVFWFLTTPKDLPVKQFAGKSLPGILLVILAYQLRTEMLLLMLPFIGFALFVHWCGEKPFLAIEKLKKYGAVFGLMLLGMVLSQIVDVAAYGSAEWKDFRQFFDERTAIYDFYPDMITRDEYSDTLGELGVSASQQTLLRNYNFGLDEEIDTRLLAGIADYAVDNADGARDWGAVFKEKLLFYRYRTFHADDAPYNLLVILGYAVYIISAVILYREERQHDARKAAGKLSESGIWITLLVLLRSALWLFILLRGRDPERITHSLYLVEFVLLAGMILRQSQKCGGGRQTRFLWGCITLFLILAAGRLAVSLPVVKADQSRRETVNQDWYAIDSYCRARGEDFYFEDVYSTVAFSGKLFVEGDNTRANYD